MLILQTVGGDGGGVGTGSWVTDIDATGTTFRQNSYIHRLNRTLQAELRLVQTYGGVLGRFASEHPFHGFCADHQRAGKDLVRLIISNHGIPEETPALSLGFTKTFVQFCSSIPSRFFEKARQTTLAQLERHQLHSYQRLLEEAPGRDVEALTALLRLTEEHLQHFDPPASA
jgi:hypothetical protein